VTAAVAIRNWHASLHTRYYIFEWYLLWKSINRNKKQIKIIL